MLHTIIQIHDKTCVAAREEHPGVGPLASHATVAVCVSLKRVHVVGSCGSSGDVSLAERRDVAVLHGVVVVGVGQGVAS